MSLDEVQAASPWLTVYEVAAYTKLHRKTILAALRKGELVGHQRQALGQWRIHRDQVDAWLIGEDSKPRSPRRRRRAA